MISGATALFFYSLCVGRLLMRFRWPALGASTLALLLWMAVALGSQQLILG